jgi:hypothetical protein
MAVWYSLLSFVIFFQIWNVWTKKNLATLTTTTTTKITYLQWKCIKRKQLALFFANEPHPVSELRNSSPQRHGICSENPQHIWQERTPFLEERPDFYLGRDRFY